LSIKHTKITIKNQPRILIIGAGPSGIGAAWNLKRRKYANWSLFEQNAYPGGLSASFRDKRGFTWDLGGHVLFTRHSTFRRFLADIPHGGLNRLQRNAWIYTNPIWVPYPLQNNIHFLPWSDYQRCLRSLQNRTLKTNRPAHFLDLLISRFGSEMAQRYLIPLNRKMWSWPLSNLSVDWVEPRISPLRPSDLNIHTKSRIRNRQWGGNHDFAYPMRGGIGQIFQAAARQLDERINYRLRVGMIQPKNKTVIFTNGRREKYDELIYTGDIRDFSKMLSESRREIVQASRNLKSNALFVLGLGLKNGRSDARTWMYFPTNDMPFFRVTHLSNYSANNIPPGGAQNGFSSWLLEIRANPKTERQKNAILRDSLKGLVSCGLIRDQDKANMVSIFTCMSPTSYPLPTLDRDRHLATIQNYLKKYQIHSLGRFGAFQYEQGNMDDCFMQGFEAVDQIFNS